jgi:glycine cleavage system H protein
MDPKTLKFAQTHEWVSLDGKTATIGISDFAVKELTDLVFIQLPEVGRQVEAGDTFGEVESVKAVSDLYAPLSGTVTEVNSKLINDLAPLSDDPFGAGWIMKLTVTDAAQAQGLMTYDAYQQFCASQAH